MPAGVTALSSVGPSTWTFFAATPPMVTLAPATNSVPLIVTSVSPAVVPEDGSIDSTVGMVSGVTRAPPSGSRSGVTSPAARASCGSASRTASDAISATPTAFMGARPLRFGSCV